jgi:hypothetical protein
VSERDHNKKKVRSESYTHYPTDKPDELTLRTENGEKVRVTTSDLPRSNLGQGGEVSNMAIRHRLRLKAEEKLEEQTENELEEKE